MKRHSPLLALMLLLIACATNKGVIDTVPMRTPNRGDPDEGTPADTGNTPVDMDGDGWGEGDDCNDHDETVNPDALEQCNGVDDDCNGEIDDGVGENWFVDVDGDSYGREPLGQSCHPPDGAVSIGGDCADNDPDIHPGSTALVDGRDSDCDGLKDWNLIIFTAVDDAGELCLNNEFIGPAGGWVNGEVYEGWLRTGIHTVGIHGWDTGRVITAAIAHLEISDGSMWVTDSTWRYDPDPDQDGVGKDGWCGPGFDDSSWDLAQDIGPIGDPSNPWGSAPSLFPAGSPARWIWDHFPVDLNTQYLRTEFELP
jgi:hypothetical protein